MYACLYLHQGVVEEMHSLAAQYSPHMEAVDERTAVIAVYGLERMFGSLLEIADRIGKDAVARQLAVSLAIASHPDTAVLAAQNIEGITVIEPGSEVEILGPLPVCSLPTALAVIDELMRWGVEDLTGFSELPPLGVIARLGQEGGRLQALVEGRGTRPLRITRPAEDYTAQVHLDEPLSNSEPLLFLLSGMIHDITRRLASHGLAVGGVKTIFEPMHESVIEFPASIADPQVILKQVQLDLEAHPPRKAVTAFSLELQPSPPSAIQHGMFTPAAPEPALLQTLLARLRGLVGSDSVGSPERLNTHRPDAWRLRPNALFEAGKLVDRKETKIRLAFRCYRPILQARVAVTARHRPDRVEAQGVRGRVLAFAGPWRTSGEWWAETIWGRDEWDVCLDDGALYRIFRDHRSKTWFVEGVYDSFPRASGPLRI